MNRRENLLATSVTAISNGLDYQAYLFWLEASRLFIKSSNYQDVGYELDAPKSLDDVAVFHANKKRDSRGDLYDTDYYQVKYHMDQRDQVTAAALVDPNFIGAKSESFLQKLKRARDFALSKGQSPRFHLVSPWAIDKNDPLASLVSNGEGEIIISKLQEGKTDRSEMGQIRKLWREHLGLKTDEELYEVIHPVRIQNAQNMGHLKRELTLTLQLAGLLPLDDAKRTDPYPHLIRKLRAEGKSVFNLKLMQEICTSETLLLPVADSTTELPRRIGIRSFYRFAENMETETDRMISLLHYFDRRQIKDPSYWTSHVKPEIKELINSELEKTPKALELHLDTHMTCAALAGYFLDPKSGVETSLVQKTMSAKHIWHNSSKPEDQDKPKVRVTEEVSMDSSVGDQAFAISITQMTFAEVVGYVKTHVPSVSRIQRLEMENGAGNSRIESGGHATLISEQIRNVIKERRATMPQNATIHLFISAPNGVVFFLSRLLRPLGRIQLYEYSFDGSLPTIYVPSVTLTPEL